MKQNKAIFNKKLKMAGPAGDIPGRPLSRPGPGARRRQPVDGV